MATRTAFSGALCGEALEFLGLFRKEVPSGVWGGASKSAPSLRSVLELGWLRYVVALEQWRSRLLAPRQGGGVRLRGNVLLHRSPLHPVCRFAQDDTVGDRGAVPNMFGVKYSTVKLTDTAFCFSSRAPATLCVILSEAAPLAKSHAHPPTIAAQSNPAPSGAPAGGISLAKKYRTTPRTALYPQSWSARCGEYPQKTRGAGGK